MGVFAAIPFKGWLAIAIILGMIVGGVILWGAFGGMIKTWRYGSAISETTKTLEIIEETNNKLKQRDVTIAEQTKRIASLRKEAALANEVAKIAEREAARWMSQTQELKQKVAQLEAARRQQIPVRTIEEAKHALGELGYRIGRSDVSDSRRSSDGAGGDRNGSTSGGIVSGRRPII